MKNNLKKIREDIGITQTSMAKHLGITLQSYFNKEQGKNEFTISEAFKISKVLNKNINDIFLPKNTPKQCKNIMEE